MNHDELEQRISFLRAQLERDRQEPPDGHICAKCSLCGAGIFEGEDCYKIGRDFYCESCIDDCRVEMEAS